MSESVPSPAVARICPNGTEGVTVLSRDVAKKIALIEEQGGTPAAPIPLNDDWWFVYGVKVLIGE